VQEKDSKPKPTWHKALIVLGVIVCIALAAMGGLGMGFGLLGMPE